MTETATTTPVAAVTDCPIFSGPRKTGRLGNALGVDLGSQDMTLAVSRDNRMPRASVVVTTAARHMIRISKAGEKIEAIAVYGSAADPTLHPDFREIAENLRELRNKWFAKAKLCLVLDNPHLEDPSLRRSLSLFDRVYVRVEWGTAKTFAALTGRKSVDYTNLMTVLGSTENLILQTRFLKGDGIDNTTDAELKAWMKKVAELKPREVLVFKSEKGLGKKVKSLPKGRLTEISQEVSSKLGIPSTVLETDSVLD
jgi:wyosine [tRNA(Phe)-imidazoG37] synthetase (radical SAM superfamily)